MGFLQYRAYTHFGATARLRSAEYGVSIAVIMPDEAAIVLATSEAAVESGVAEKIMTER